MILAEYLRLSKDDGTYREESCSITSQRSIIDTYINSQPDLQVYSRREYCDDGYTGSNMDRPGMIQLLEDVRRGEIQCIIVKDLSRFSRDYIEIGEYLNQILPFMGVRFIAITDKYDSKNQTDNMLSLGTGFQTIINDFYSKENSIKIKSSMYSRLDRGEYFFYNVPLGYRKTKDNQIIIEEREAAIVRKIIDMALRGCGYREIARTLNDEGVPSYAELRGRKYKNGRQLTRWNSQYIWKILNNSFYIGDLIYGKTYRPHIGSNQIKAHPQEKWKVLHNHHEALMTLSEYEKVATYRGKPKNDHCEGKVRRQQNLLAGYVCCGECGATMILHSDSRRPQYNAFRCDVSYNRSHSTCCRYCRVDYLESIVIKRLGDELKLRLDCELISEKYRNLVQERIGCAKADLAEAERECEQNSKELVVFFETYVEGEITAEAYVQRKNKIIQRQKELEEQKEMHKSMITECKKILDMRSIGVNKLLQHMGFGTISSELLREYVDKIIVYGDKRIEIKWNFKEDYTVV